MIIVREILDTNVTRDFIHISVLVKISYRQLSQTFARVCSRLEKRELKQSNSVALKLKNENLHWFGS